MKRVALSTLLVATLAIVGCENKSPPGGPGANRNNGTPAVGTPDDTFRVSVPSADIKQGESKTVAVSITRGTNFDQDVKLTVSDVPQGVTIGFDHPSIRASDKETKLTIEAHKDAALGAHKVMITATPMRSGSATSAEMKIEIKKP